MKASKRLDLPESGYQALKTVHTLAGVYSEIFIKADTVIGIGRLLVGDFQKLLYSTDPRDWHAIEQEKRRRLQTLLAANKRLNTAYILKEQFGQLWEYRRETGFPASLFGRRLHFSRFRAFVGDYLPAVAVDGLFIATQYDVVSSAGRSG